MKRKLVYWSIIIFVTVLTVFVDMIVDEKIEREYQFIWSLLLLPCILIMMMYPNWKVIVGSTFSLTLLKYATELSQIASPDKFEIIAHILSSFVNWAILLTIGYFRIEYNKLFKKVQELTLTDSLTGINNRRYFDLFMEKTIPMSQRMNTPLILILFDIDHFKTVNDNYGHLAGDQGLKHIAGIIERNVRNSDAYVRFGGEEFAIISPNTNLEDGQKLAERIREDVEKSECTYNDECINLTISLGVSLYSGETVAEFIKKTDKALYKAKENGRNQVAVYH